MGQLLNILLTFILIYGYPAISGIILLNYVGLPVSLNILILAAGSFAANGNLKIYWLIPIAALSATLGDVFNYYIGRKFGHLIINRFTKKIGFTQERLDSSEKFLNKWGRWCILITRCLLTPITVPVNLIAGISKYSFKKFLTFAFIGELLWATIYIYLGYFFGANWQTISDYVNQTPSIFLWAIAGAALLFTAYRIFKMNRS